VPQKATSLSAMPLVKEDSIDSIAGDSTLSSSPPPPAQVKRAVHTYGRRQPTQVDESTSVANLESSTVRRQIYRTAPPDVDEEIPQSSSPSQESAQPRPKFEFSWKKLLRDMDKERPEDVAISSGNQDESNGFTGGDLDSSDPFRERDDASPSVPQASECSSSPNLKHSRLSPAKSPLESSLTYKQIKKRYGISASNLEEGPSSPITPEFPHCINTPKLRSSPTLPTSDEDRGLGSPAATHNKSLDNDESVVPLRMEEISGPSQFAAVTSTRLAKSKSTSRKHSKIKVRCTL
jgi:hypothetical protein